MSKYARNSRNDLHISKKNRTFAVLLLNDIHNKDYSVVKTFRVGRKSRPFLLHVTRHLAPNAAHRRC